MHALPLSHAWRSPDGPHRAKVALSRSSDRDRLGITFSQQFSVCFPEFSGRLAYSLAVWHSETAAHDDADAARRTLVLRRGSPMALFSTKQPAFQGSLFVHHLLLLPPHYACASRGAPPAQRRAHPRVTGFSKPSNHTDCDTARRAATDGGAPRDGSASSRRRLLLLLPHPACASRGVPPAQRRAHPRVTGFSKPSNHTDCDTAMRAATDVGAQLDGVAATASRLLHRPLLLPRVARALRGALPTQRLCHCFFKPLTQQ